MATTFSLKQGETRASHGPNPHPLIRQKQFHVIYKFPNVRVLILNQRFYKLDDLITPKWSRGVPMDPKISFRAPGPKRRISWRCRFLTFTWLPPRIFWHVFEKNCAARCAAIVLGSLWTPPRWPPTGRHFDLWWLYIKDLSYIVSMKISLCTEKGTS